MPQASAGKNITDTSQINDGIVTGADIADDTITNADVKTTAAIAATKLNLANAIGNGEMDSSDPIAEDKIGLSDNTTNDVSTTKHGFVPKAPNQTTKFLRGDATWSTVPASNKITQGFSDLTQNGADTNEHTLLTATIPAGTLGTAQCVRVRIFGQIQNRLGSVTNTIRLKYGTTTVGTITLTEAVESINYDFRLEVLIFANASASAQTVKSILQSGTDAQTLTTTKGYAAIVSGTATENSANQLDFTLTTQLSSTSNSQQLVINFFTVEAING